MKPLLSLLLVLSFAFMVPGAGHWKNGGESKSINLVIFGTHDWIAWKAFQMADENEDLNWLDTNQNYLFFGTEAPDVGLSKLPAAFRAKVISESNGKKYADTGRCHCVLYKSNGDPIKTVAADRIVEEFNKARKAAKEKRWKYAAFYIGAMAHYAGDLSQFMHVMGKNSRWNNGQGDDQKVHAYYEKSFDARVDFHQKSLPVLEPFIKKVTVSGGSVGEIALGLARFTDTSKGGQHDIDWLYSQAVSNYTKKINKPALWDNDLLTHSGANVNYSINVISKLIGMITE